MVTNSRVQLLNYWIGSKFFLLVLVFLGLGMVFSTFFSSQSYSECAFGNQHVFISTKLSAFRFRPSRQPMAENRTHLADNLWSGSAVCLNLGHDSASR